MAAHKFTRSGGKKTPLKSGNRIRTHPKRNAASEVAARLAAGFVDEFPVEVPRAELRSIRFKLKRAQSCASVAAAALDDETDLLDSQASQLLSAHVVDALHIQILRIDRLLGKEVREDDIAEDKG